MRKGYLYLILVLILGVISCGNRLETPAEYAERMRDLACASDKAGFYSNIDRSLTEKNLRISIREQIIENSTGLSYTKDDMDAVVNSLAVLKWEVFNREMLLGKEGAICNMVVVDDPSSKNIIKTIFPDGTRITWGLEPRDGQMLLVSISDNDSFNIEDMNTLFRKTTITERSERKTLDESNKSVQKGNISEKIDNNDLIVSEHDGETETTSDGKQEPQIAAKTEEPNEESSLDIQTDIGEPVPKEDVITIEDTPENKEIVRSNGNSDFGSAKWGMNKQQVIAFEGSNPMSDSENKLKYSGSLNGSKAELDYIFSGGRLVKGRYKIVGPKSDEGYYLNNYKQLKEHLTSRFGQPAIDQEQWVNPTYKDNTSRHAFAVYIGHLSLKSKWVTPRSDILLELDSKNYDMQLEVTYHNK